MNPITREDAKALLAGKGNKLAGKALEVIKRGGALDELKEVVEKGAADKFWTRKGRNGLVPQSVLDACFGADLDIVSQEPLPGGGGTARIGPTPVRTDTVPHFAYLLDKGFTPGSNGWRGSLFTHIYNETFSESADPDQNGAFPFAKELSKRGLVTPKWFEHAYQWVSKPDHLPMAEQLGLDPKSGEALDCCLRYVGCARTSREPSDARAKVISYMLANGAQPSDEAMLHTLRDKNARAYLDGNNLTEKLVAVERRSEISGYLIPSVARIGSLPSGQNPAAQPGGLQSGQAKQAGL